MYQFFRFLLTPITDINQYKNVINLLFYLIVIILALRYIHIIGVVGDPWITGDWLINYQAGVIRRGLFGQIVYLLNNYGFDPLKVIFFTHALIYWLIATLTMQLFFSKQRHINHLALLLSPLFIIPFTFYDFAGGFRKEIIGILAFLLINIALIQSSKSLTITSYLVFILAAFSHEINALFLPFFLYLFYIHLYKENKPLFLIHCMLFSVISLLATSFAVIYSDNVNTAKNICSSLMNIGFGHNICSGSIKYLAMDSKSAFDFTWQTINYYDYFSLYTSVILLAILPFLFIENRIKNITAIAIGFVALSPLFIVAIDWGRWLMIIFTFATLIVFNHPVANDKKNLLITPVILLLFISLWSVPHCCNHDLGAGLLGILR